MSWTATCIECSHEETGDDQDAIVQWFSDHHHHGISWRSNNLEEVVTPMKKTRKKKDSQAE